MIIRGEIKGEKMEAKGDEQNSCKRKSFTYAITLP